MFHWGGGGYHKKNVNKAIDKLVTTIPLLETSTWFYGKRLYLYVNKLLAHVEKSQSDPFEVKLLKNVPQQEPSSKYVFLSFIDFIKKHNPL